MKRIITDDNSAFATTDTDRFLAGGDVWIQPTRPVMIINAEDLSRAIELGFLANDDYVDE